ncbi:MAG TPA: prolyl oligopeptidase family serine peptidase, partial [Gracilimonas sp.]|nr:prolyl oligopeptidase family serine peptidase [Gracilimonas sp.]
DPNKKYPLILEIHGGPYSSYGPQFTPELQLMASRGYVVVYTNPRGSTSYGPDFASYINLNYPSEDYNDLMDATDYVIDQGYIDEDNLFITGGSGGGVLTAWSIGMTDRFAAAVVAKPVINWYSFALTADGAAFYSKYWFSKRPWEDPEQYLERSPISLVGNVSTPTMLLTGEQDYRTPMSETEQYYAALKIREVESVMVRIQGSGHGIAAKPSNLIRKVGYIVGWFDRYKN